MISLLSVSGGSKQSDKIVAAEGYLWSIVQIHEKEMRKPRNPKDPTT